MKAVRLPGPRDEVHILPATQKQHTMSPTDTQHMIMDPHHKTAHELASAQEVGQKWLHRTFPVCDCFADNSLHGESQPEGLVRAEHLQSA